MSIGSAELFAQLQTRGERHIAERIVELVRCFERVVPEQREEALAQIHDFSARLDYIGDHDFGAIVLEEVADSLSDPDLKQPLYRHALYRALWCTQAASAGGEAISRARDWNRIKEKVG